MTIFTPNPFSRIFACTLLAIVSLAVMATPAGSQVSNTRCSLPWLDVTDFGAIGNGVADDTAAIQATIDAAGTGGVVLFRSDRTYRTTKSLTSGYDDQIWLLHRAVILVDFVGIGITIGESDKRHRRIHLHGGHLKLADHLTRPGTIGARWVNTNFCSWDDFDILGFDIGLQLLAENGEGQSYFTGRPASIRGCRIGIDCYAKDANSWVNENGFFGNGSISYGTSDPDSSDGYAIRLDYDKASGAWPPNNVKFFGLSLENPGVTAGDPAGAVFVNGQSCTFWGLRYEWNSTPFISGGEDWMDNVFAGGIGLRGAADIDTASVSPDFQVYGSRTIYLGGGDNNTPDALLTLKEVNSTTNALLRCYGVDPTTPPIFEIRADGLLTIGPAGTPIRRHNSGTTSWTPPLVVAGGFESTTVPVTHAALGDTVCVSFDQPLPAGVLLSGSVTASGQVTVTLANLTDDDLSLDPGTLRADIWQH